MVTTAARCSYDVCEFFVVSMHSIVAMKVAMKSFVHYVQYLQIQMARCLKPKPVLYVDLWNWLFAHAKSAYDWATSAKYNHIPIIKVWRSPWNTISCQFPKKVWRMIFERDDTRVKMRKFLVWTTYTYHWNDHVTYDDFE